MCQPSQRRQSTALSAATDNAAALALAVVAATHLAAAASEIDAP
jgi:hypothetical protein